MDTAFWWVQIVVTALCVTALGCSAAFARQAHKSRLANRRALDLEGRLTELEADCEAIRQSLKRLHSRAGMRELREKRGQTVGDNEIPDWQADPEQFRAWARRQHLLKQPMRQ